MKGRFIQEMKTRGIAILVAAILIPMTAAVIGSAFTTPEIPGWYESLNKPFFQPPNWLFGPVWTILYIMMGISAYLIWKRGLEREEIKNCFLFFILQITLNVLWSIIFFGLKELLFAFVELAFLWIAILVYIISAYKIDRRAAYLFIPYLAWVSFAGVLNFSVWLLNA
jgi:benzodiazapine receptor